MNSNPIIAQIYAWLQGVKYVNGPSEVQYSLRKHPKIRQYLRDYLADQAVDIENDIDTLLKH